jgi:hypothetical protein
VHQLIYPALTFASPYSVRYSGGVENLINFQERWGNSTNAAMNFRFSGTLTAPWLSLELQYEANRRRYGFYLTSIYKPPVRKFDYNEDLRVNPPPGTPGLFSIQRLSFDKKRDG